MESKVAENGENLAKTAKSTQKRSICKTRKLPMELEAKRAMPIKTASDRSAIFTEGEPVKD